MSKRESIETNNDNSKIITGLSDIKLYSPADLAVFLSFGRWKQSPHLDCINDMLLDLCSGNIKKLIVNMPPRHGKSEFISKYFVAWHLLRYPDKRIILTSYSNTFAQMWGRKVRELIDEFGKECFGIEIKKNIRSFKSFELEGFDGGLHCAGAGSSITGRGADLLIIDDPVKNSAEAGSKAKRDNLFDWFQSTALSRLEPDAITILIMTRWNTSDLAGKIIDNPANVKYADYKSGDLLKLDDEKWLILSFPAFAEENDALGRKPGEALWAVRYDEAALQRIKEQSGVFWFNALYQQNPLSDESALFKRKYFKYFYDDNDYYYLGSRCNPEITIPKNDCIVRATVDLAVTNKDSSDYTVVLVFTVSPEAKVLVLDIYREKLSGSEQVGLIDSVIGRWQPQIIGIESVQYQAAFIDMLLSRGINILSLYPKGKKFDRAQGINTRLQAGNVFFAANAAWLGEFEKELIEFDKGTYDDQVDAFAYVNYMIPRNTGFYCAGAKRGGSATEYYTF